MNKVDMLVDLAKEVESTDPVDWGMLSVDEDEVYRLVALSVVELEDNILVLKASLTKLLVENFVLNLKLLRA